MSEKRSRMNLLHVSAAYPPFLGGAEVYTQAMSKRFAGEGHQVTVVTTNAEEVEYFWNPQKRHLDSGHERDNDIEVIRWPVSHLPFSPWSFYALRHLATILARRPTASRPILRWLAPYMPGVPDIERGLSELPGHFDVVHGVNIALEWPLIAAWRYARDKGLPFVTTPFVHVGEQENRDVLINYVMPHQLEVLQDADAVIVQTDIEKESLTRLGVKNHRIHRLGMGIDLEELEGGKAQRFRSRHHLEGPVVTFLGVVTYDKGSFYLARAMEHLWSLGEQAHLVIAGPQVDEFVRFYDRLLPETRERILLLGPVLGRDKKDLLAATDVFALPSRIDSFGIVYLEAWAYGKPVIGARAGGVPDVIDEGQDGLLVEFGDARGLADAIHGLLKNPERSRAMGERGRAKVESRYTWRHVYDRLEMLYCQLVG